MAYGKSSEGDEIVKRMKGAPMSDEESMPVDKEAKMAAAEEILEALRTKDAAALSEALEAHYAACGG
jgi:hypothetical protein